MWVKISHIKIIVSSREIPSNLNKITLQDYFFSLKTYIISQSLFFFSIRSIKRSKLLQMSNQSKSDS